MLQRVYVLAFAMLITAPAIMYADNRPYQCEFGVQAGLGYYVGDATKHVFQNVREAYGAQFRYKFNKRWALQVKGMTQRITGPMDDWRTTTIETATNENWTNQLINLDVMAEYNFFRLSDPEYDRRVKTYSPYIALGIGAALSGEKFRTFSCYLPVGVGFKWKFCRMAGLNILWQHNIYFMDNLEGMEHMGDTHQLNGGNIMNFDVSSQLVLGIVVEFAQKRKICVSCGN